MHVQALSLRACVPSQLPNPTILSSDDTQHLLRAAELAESSAGLTAPHPNFGCVIAHGPKSVGEGFLYAQGTKSAEVLAVERAGELAKNATAYLNLEPGDCHGDASAVRALRQAGVSRVVIGISHPLQHLHGKAISALRQGGVHVEVGGQNLLECGSSTQEALKACQLVNAPFLFRAANSMPYSILKYAITVDGKIATSTGHSYWVSSTQSRKRVFETRARSDAVIVGGNTVRRDNPRLTTRQEGGNLPVRIVMSRCLNLPKDANLWDVSTTQTIVMTQKGANPGFQKILASKGVEVVEFDVLTPRAVMEHCYDRGFLSVLWECGGTLAAPAIASGAIQKVMAFISPKIIGGITAPTPVGELGMAEMTQALQLSDVAFEQIGPDMLMTGFLQAIPSCLPEVTAVGEAGAAFDASIASSPQRPKVIHFYKPWDPYGALSNFSPHPISLPNENETIVSWKSVEHYYQAQKFAGVRDSLAEDFIHKIRRAKCPEEATRMGRTLARQRPDLVRKDWAVARLVVMETALRAKFLTYSVLRDLLLSTGDAVLVGGSHDMFWGAGRNGKGENKLGLLLMHLRSHALRWSALNEVVDRKCESIAWWQG
ncbi:riboflavin biosynthesis protein PYRR, chloroplastic [Physcomitrium patens]|uniref:5-amino-6-(5-phosphoribosylamino)uracil reductase n=1 Tax=Physcomitrium patens TaxID=3218 RepID=A0A2K1IXT6_PHYPA|nr:riboflavin biosynthesis protein PYRR, chloroplastic-like [Physcomitrium patens]PNR34094.1 hypothetical protein PHYPA_023911 [Physcomitrium patens]|eukprot:XP_024356782.1 riboflavin biosynthesis protein PYRR, chloroplastic-like [Physcomitrella patens]